MKNKAFNIKRINKLLYQFDRARLTEILRAIFKSWVLTEALFGGRPREKFERKLAARYGVSREETHDRSHRPRNLSF